MILATNGFGQGAGSGAGAGAGTPLPTGGGSWNMFKEGWGTIMGPSLFEWWQTKQQMDISKMWGFAPPYMVAYNQQKQPEYASVLGTLLPIVVVVVGGIVIFKALK